MRTISRIRSARSRVDPAAFERFLGAAAADRVQERLGVVPEEREQ